METVQMSIDGWRDKQNVSYTFNGILFSLIKGNPDIHYSIDELWRYTQWNKPDTGGQILYDSIYMDLE